MPIIQAGSTNTNSIIVPDVYVQIIPPVTLLNGVPTNIVGVVGTAPWGPVNVSTVIGTIAEYQATFGPVQNRKYDMGTQVAVSYGEGAANFRCVRVTDTTDVAASAIFNGTASNNCGFVATSLYTGSGANGDTLTLSTGSKAGSYKLTIARPGAVPEVFDNITGTGATFWTALVAAVNTGVSQNNATPNRSPSAYVTLTDGSGSNNAASPGSLSLPLTITLGSGTGAVSGTDGAGSITPAEIVGQDTSPRKGMYVLRGAGAGIGVLADVDDPTEWTVQEAFGLAEGVYMMLTCPAGSPIQNGSTGSVDLKTTAGVDTYACKLMHGDWIYWNDQTNGIVRLVSPQGFAAGRLANLSPEQSSLNKQLLTVIGSQKSGIVGSGQLQTYAAADLAALIGAGIDVICNPQPGGSYWGIRGGINTSSNASIDGDEYTRLTNYIAETLSAGMGIYVGKVINSALFDNIRATQLAFLNNMLGQGLLGSTDGSLPFSVKCDASNNPQSRTALGYVQSDAQIRYQGINRKFIVNIQGGASVVVSQSPA